MIQSFTRAKAEKEAMRDIITNLLAAQIPVLSWWALAAVATKAAALGVTEKAVAKHINSIFAKLDLPVDLEVNRRVQAVRVE